MLVPRFNLQLFFYYLSCALGLSLLACQANEEVIDDYANCRYEKPEAIFYEGLPQISNHQFRNKGKGTEESFRLSSGIEVSILQYGCDYRTQEFIFSLGSGAKIQEPEDCVRQTIEVLQSFSRLGPDYHVFRAWAQEIKSIKRKIRLGKVSQIGEGFYIKVNLEENFGSTTLMLTLSEKE